MDKAQSPPSSGGLPAYLTQPEATGSWQAAAGSGNMRSELDRYGITEIVKPVYEWGGYRYTNPLDAIAAAKRARK